MDGVAGAVSLQHRVRRGRLDRELEGDHAVAGRLPAESHLGDQLVEMVDRPLVEGDDDQVAPGRAVEHRGQQLGIAQELGLVVVAALDLDVDRRAREPPQHLGEPRHAEVGALEAARGLAVARPHAAQAREFACGVEPADLGEREIGHVAGAVRGPVDGPIVHHDQVSVRRGVHVQLEHVRARGDRLAERIHRVRGELVLAALVGHVHERFPEPRVLGGGGSGQG
jgi:hypothetical protein